MAGEVGDATRLGKGWQDSRFPSSPGQRGPSMALLGLVLAGDVVLGDAGVRGVCAPALCFRVKMVNVFGKALLESHGGFWVAHPPWFETHESSLLLQLCPNILPVSWALKVKAPKLGAVLFWLALTWPGSPWALNGSWENIQNESLPYLLLVGGGKGRK